MAANMSGGGSYSGGNGGGSAKEPLHPLIAALLQTLPPANADWLEQERKDWLAMAAMAFNVVYGRAEGPPPLRASEASPTRAVARTTRPEHEAAGCELFVGLNDEVRGPVGRVNADEVNGEVIYDYRRGSARSRDTVIWADDSVGARAGMEFCGPG